VRRIWIPLLAATATAFACSSPEDEAAPVPSVGEAGPTHAAMDAEPPRPQEVSTGLVGAVIETMDSGGYTYVLLKTPKAEVWAAAPPTIVDVGQVVEVADPMPMRGFHSGSLDRTFDLIYFASGLSAPSGAGIPTGAAARDQVAEPTHERVLKAAGGQTVAELFEGRETWVGQSIRVRGEVVKFTPDIMGKNWLHLRDGSGAEGTNDLTVTTSEVVAVGDIVLVEGTLEGDKDFGFGYRYDLILEDAQVTVE